MVNFVDMSSKTFDLIIIGGGPIGLACGLEAKKKKLNYLIIEKGPLVNSLYNYPVNMTFFSTSEKLEIDNIPFISIKPKPSKQEALEYYRRIASNNNLKINLFEKVENVLRKEKCFNVKTNKSSYLANKIIVATGFYDIPNRLNIPGENLSKVSHYYNDPHYYAGMKTVVVGASNSAVDAALEIYRKGGEVTMVVRGDDIGERVKYWVRPDIINRIKEGSIDAFFNSELKEIKQHAVVIKKENEQDVTINNDFVLALIGYQPNISFLEKMGIQITDEQLKIPSYNESTMETNVPGIYLAGVICGGMETHKWFIENSRIHAKMIIEDIVRKK
tara:strand:+ start:11853 stop:12845 length:993 start_codon:yes stop_codon:yes gene_type:complete